MRILRYNEYIRKKKRQPFVLEYVGTCIKKCGSTNLTQPDNRHPNEIISYFLIYCKCFPKKSLRFYNHGKKSRFMCVCTVLLGTAFLF